MRKPARTLLLPLFLIFFAASCASPKTGEFTRELALYDDSHLQSPQLLTAHCVTSGARFAVASGSGAAAKAGRKTGHAEGTVVDAAIAAAFVLAVERPYATSLGGGGMLLVHRPLQQAKTTETPSPDGENVLLDFLASTPVLPSLPNAQLVGAPGFVAGLREAHRRFGRRPWAELLAPAIELADKGFLVPRDLAEAIGTHWDRLQKQPYMATLFGRPGQRGPLQTGDWLKQPDLAATLRQLAQTTGEDLDKRIAQFARPKSSATEWANYRVAVREPAHTAYRGRTVYSAPPPSAGGVALIQALRVFAGFSVSDEARTPDRYLHRLAQVQKFAVLDQVAASEDPVLGRADLDAFLGDRRISVLRGLTRAENAATTREIAPALTTADSGVNAVVVAVDADGNAVSLATTIGGLWGSALAVPGTGVVLNDSLAGFGGTPLVPGKRPPSQLAPAIVSEDGRAILAVAAAGGPRAWASVLQTILGYIDLYGANLARTVFAPREHHPWIPDELEMEKGLLRRYGTALHERGHEVRAAVDTAAVQAVSRKPQGSITGVTDPRAPGGAEAW